MCEKQITVPDNSLLYCSARYVQFLGYHRLPSTDVKTHSCRRKDSRKPLSASLITTTSMTPSTSPPASPPMSPRSIAPMTASRTPIVPVPSIRIPPEFHDAKTDLDPTEWKPKISTSPSRISSSLASSEAWRYLSQFHGGDEAMFPARRAGAGHRSTSSLSTLTSTNGTVPGLIHTPSTVASSFSSTASDDVGNADSVHRPLPPRHNPFYSGGANATKGLDLVVPHVETPSESGVVVSVAPSRAQWEDLSEKAVTVTSIACDGEDLS